MKFIVQQNGASLPSNMVSVFILKTDKWDDFGHVCQFHLSYRDKTGSTKRIGAVKILPPQAQKRGASGEQHVHTKLRESFTTLDEGYISLGQSDDYYRNLHLHLNQSEIGEVLEALFDIAWQPSLAHPFEPTSAFRNAMMRENDALRARRFGRAWALGNPISERFSFSYEGMIPRAAMPVESRFDFDDEDDVPGRIAAIVGRNAVGKTQFLANLAKDLTHITRTSSENQKIRDERFTEGRPLFTRVITLSYSAFDKFARPKDPGASYVYCGIRSDSGSLSRRHLIDTYRENQQRIVNGGRKNQWVEYMQEILGESNDLLKNELLAEINSQETDESSLQLLSSGQSILVHFVTALAAWIQPNSLILFDEPETHLHPNAVASLFNVLTKILNRNESFAIVATHSPIVLQEIPSKLVQVFQREGDITTAEPLELESFGESITELTRHVFETNEIETLYRKTLRTLARMESAEETMDRFEHGLSLSAQAYLIAQHAKKKN
jgi:energy-coupling factor transporter ATP-binding protein EcfA2